MPRPSGAHIKKILSFNNAEMFNKIEEEKLLYSGFDGKASKCKECGQCEEKCPQQTHIREMLKEVSKSFEK